MKNENFLYGNNTNLDLSLFHDAIVKSLTETGDVPEALNDIVVAIRVANGNPDGSPRFMLNAF